MPPFCILRSCKILRSIFFSAAGIFRARACTYSYDTYWREPRGIKLSMGTDTLKDLPILEIIDEWCIMCVNKMCESSCILRKRLIYFFLTIGPEVLLTVEMYSNFFVKNLTLRQRLAKEYWEVEQLHNC